MLLITLENLGGTVLPVNALKSSKKGSTSGSPDTRLHDVLGEEHRIRRESGTEQLGGVGTLYFCDKLMGLVETGNTSQQKAGGRGGREQRTGTCECGQCVQRAKTAGSTDDLRKSVAAFTSRCTMEPVTGKKQNWS